MKLFLNLYRQLKYFVLAIKYSLLFSFQKNKSIESVLSKCNLSILFITHNLGGGTLTFEKNYFSSCASPVLICRMISYKKNLFFRLEDAEQKHILYIRDKDFASLFKYAFTEVILNSLCSFFSIEKYINKLCEYKEKNPHISFRYFVHDFHCICPTVNLVADNWNCSLECGKHKCAFDSFLNRYSGTISEWRKLWKPLLLQADEIRCFSEDSKRILLKAYPDLQEKRISVKPHSMDWCRFTKIQGIESLPIHIGIIGSVYSVPKGKYVVRELLRRLSPEIPISVVGATKMQIRIRRKNVRYIGKYKHDDLQKIIEHLTISAVLFPSIWSETFSYLVSEHIQMNIPVICFDFGAQADKVRKYAKGIVCHDTDEMVQAVMNLASKEKKNALSV